jgi:Flp pilus assembly protein TadB
MRLRLILQPAWVRFMVWALFLAVWWGLFTGLQSSYEFEGAVLSAIVFGAALGGYFTVTTQGANREAHEAVSGLDQSGRSQAIDAVLHGVVPTDPDVRASATRLGRIYLRNKSADQLKRAEIGTWIMFGVLIAAAVVAAVAFDDDRVPFIVLAVLAAILLPVSLIRSRRIQRNVALLAEGSD